MAWVFNPFTGTFDQTGAGGGGSTSPGGSSGQVQYNNGGAFGGMSGTTWSDANQSLAIASTGTGTGVTTSQPVLNLSQTWNAGAVTFTGLKFNATDTASASGSLLLDLQVGGASKISIDKAGSLIIPKGSSSSASIQFTGTANSGIYCRSTSQIDFLQSGNIKLEVNGNAVVINNTSLTFNANVVTNLDDCCMTRGGAGSFKFGNDTSYTNNFFLTAPSAATLQLGAADAAAPVAQTFKVQGVVAGTTNTAGANFTIQGSQGTGNAAGGSIIFQVAPAGSSGTAQNAYSTALTINSAQSVVISSSGTSSAIGTGTAALCLGGNTNAGFITTGGGIGILFSGSTMAAFRNNEVRIASNVPFGFASGADPTANALDVLLYRDAANTLALRNSTNPQTFRVYNGADTTNFQRLTLSAGVTSNMAVVAADNGGTGVAMGLQFGAALTTGGGVTNIFNINTSGHMLWNTDNTYDIGASGANRPRNVFASGSINGADIRCTNSFQKSGVFALTGSTSACIVLSDTTSFNTFDRLQFGGTSSSYPALKRSSTTLQVRLADDTAFGSFQTGGFSGGAPTIKTADYTQLEADYSLIFNGTGSITLTLLAAATYPGKILYVKTIAAQTVVSASSNVKPIDTDTAGTAILAATAGKWAMLQSDGTDWVIMAQG